MTKKIFLKKFYLVIALILLILPFLFMFSSCSYDMSSVIFADKTVIYDGEAHSIEISGNLSDEVTVTYDGNNQTEVGVYTITASFEGENSWYDSITSMSATLTIKEATMTDISFESETYTYDGEYHTIEVSGITDTDRYTVSYTNNSRKEVGIYSAIAIITDTEETYETEYLSATLTIEYATSSDITGATFESETYTYDGEFHTIEVSGITDTDRYTVSYTNNSQKNAGVYSVIAIITDTENIYETEYLSATLTIEEATAYDIEFEDVTVLYDGETHSITARNLPTGVSVTYTGNDQTEVGTYAITASFTDALGNYEIEDMTATLNIQDSTVLDLVFEDYTVTYDGTGYKIEVEGLPTDVTVSYTYNKESVDEDFTGETEAGTYEVVASFTVANDAYTIEDMYATLTIEQSDTLSDYVNFDDLYFNVYNQDSVTMTYTLVNSSVSLPDGVEYAYSDNATQTEVGTYVITVKFTDTKGNYATLSLTANMIVVYEESATENYSISTSSDTWTATIYDYTGSDTEVIVPSYVIDSSGIAYRVTAVADETFLAESVDDNNYKITSIVFNDYITSIGEKCCYYCRSLSSVTLPNNSKITEIADYCFQKSGLTSLDLPSSVDTIGTYAFAETDLVDIDLSNVTTLGTYAFSECILLTTLTLSDDLEEISDYSFEHTKLLGTINSDTEGTSYIPSSVTRIGIYAFGTDESSFMNSAMQVIVFNDNLLEIDDYAFSGFQEWTSITLNDGLLTIGNSSFAGIAGNSNGIPSLLIPSSVTYVGDYSFYDSEDLIELVFEGNGTNIGSHAFYGADELVSIEIKDSGVSSDITIGNSAFQNPSTTTNALTTVILSENVSSIGAKAFYGSKSLTTITTTGHATSGISDNSTNYMPENLEEIGNSAFYNCQTLNGDIYFFDELESVGASAFYFNFALDDVYFGGGLFTSTASTSISNYAFYRCEEIVYVYLYGVSSLGKATFTSCYDLDYIYFNERINYIGYKSFYNLNLVNIYILSFAGIELIDDIYFYVFSDAAFVSSAVNLTIDYLTEYEYMFIKC